MRGWSCVIALHVVPHHISCTVLPMTTGFRSPLILFDCTIRIFIRPLIRTLVFYVIFGTYKLSTGKAKKWSKARWNTNLGQQLIEQGRVEEALELFKRLIKVTRENVPLKRDCCFVVLVWILHYTYGKRWGSTSTIPRCSECLCIIV